MAKKHFQQIAETLGFTLALIRSSTERNKVIDHWCVVLGTAYPKFNPLRFQNAVVTAMREFT